MSLVKNIFRPLLALALALPAIHLPAQNFNQKYPSDSLRIWSAQLFTELRLKHPGFYRYNTPEKFDHLIDSTIQTISQPLTTLDYYRKLKPLIAQIGCLHTGISLSGEYEKYLQASPTMIPVEIFVGNDKRVYITKLHSSETIPVGSEIISINDRPISAIIDQLLRAIPSDGYNVTEKLLLLNYRFAFWYQVMVEETQTFRVTVKVGALRQDVILQGVTSASFPSLASLESRYKKPLELEINGDIGVMKIHSFAKSTIKAHDQKFKKFVKRSFKELATTDVKSLIVDLRYNTGGTDGNAAYLASYFFDQPFRYWEKIEVTKPIAKEISGLAALIYRKPTKSNGEFYTWRKARMTNEFDYYLTQHPAARPFKGNVYLITNGLCMSSCGDFVAILSHNKKARVVGQETGGGFQGNTSGIIPTTTIPKGIKLTVPLQKYTNAVDHKKNVGRGTLPDINMEPTYETWMSETDEEMEAARAIINKP